VTLRRAVVTLQEGTLVTLQQGVLLTLKGIDLGALVTCGGPWWRCLVG
jgi:hypothetical protein